jgi:predicted RNase H-like HicB family nuclease
MKQFIVTLTPGEDGYIVAECPSLPGCVSQGKNKEEAPENIKEAIEGILEVRREMNKPVPPPEVRLVEVTA